MAAEDGQTHQDVPWTSLPADIWVKIWLAMYPAQQGTPQAHAHHTSGLVGKWTLRIGGLLAERSQMHQAHACRRTSGSRSG